MFRGLLDLGLLLEPIEIGKYEFIRLDMKERWVVLMPPDDPLAEKEAITAGDLAKLPLILPRRMQVQSELASWFGDYYKNLNVLFTSNLSTNSAVMVSQGLAYSLVIEGAVPFWDSSKIACRPLSPNLTATSVLAWKREHADLILDIAEDIYEKEMQLNFGSSIVHEGAEILFYENGSPYLHDVITNHTDRTITETEYCMLAYDEDGHPLKIDWNFMNSSTGASYDYLVCTGGLNILPGQTEEYHGGWR